MNTPVDRGLRQRSHPNREHGGFVGAHHSIDIERIRPETLVGFGAWAGGAATPIEEANVTASEDPDADYADLFWALGLEDRSR